MLENLKKSLESTNSSMPEIKAVAKAVTNLETSISSAKTAVSNKIMKLVQEGNVEEIYKLRELVGVLNSDDVSKNLITLSSPLANRRPKAVTFLGKESKQNTWRGVTEAMLGILYENDKHSFQKLLHNTEFDTRKPYYAKSSDNMDAPVMLGSGASAIYADAARITNNEFFFLKKTLRALGHDADEVIIEIDPQYMRKPSSKGQDKAMEAKNKKTSTVKSAKESKAEEKVPAKRGRKPKATTESVPMVAKAVSNITEPSTEKKPYTGKKRGRKPKAISDDLSMVAKAIGNMVEPCATEKKPYTGKKRGRKPKNASGTPVETQSGMNQETTQA